MTTEADAAAERAIILASARLLVDRIAAYAKLMAELPLGEESPDADQ